MSKAKRQAILAVDVGSHRTGVAVSDDDRRMALPLETVESRALHEVAERLCQLVEDYEVATVVVGWPVDMSGREGKSIDRVKALLKHFERRLKRRDLDIPIEKWDERMTSSAADRLLIEADVSRRRRKDAVDQVAATKILEGYLGRLRFEEQ